MSEKPIDESSPYNEPFDDGDDWVVKDKKTGKQIARFKDQNKVLPFAYKHGRDTVDLERVKREGKTKMSEQRIVNLSEMMLKVVSEEVLLPKTNNPEKEANDLTKDTGLYHYADYDDLIKKPVIVNTNVEAKTQNEWLEKAYNSPIHEEGPVVEPSNFEKNDEYDVTVSDQIAEDDGEDVNVLHYTKANSDPHNSDIVINGKTISSSASLEKHFPKDKYGHCVFKMVSDDGREYDGDEGFSYDEVHQDMATYGSGNEEDDLSEMEDAPMAERGVNNDTGSNYGPAPTDDQNEMKFDKDGKFKISEDADNSNLINAARKAKEESKNGYVQHVDSYGDGRFGVSDWMSDDTVVSYSNGHCINGTDPLESEMGTLDEARFKPQSSQFESYVDLPDRDDVEVEVHYDIEESDPSVGYQGGVVITSVVEKGTDNDLMDYIKPEDENRLVDEAIQHVTDQHADYGDYMYDRMRDERMEREFDEGKDYRYDPDADDDDMDRNNRFKQRKQDKKDRQKNVDEAFDHEDFDNPEAYDPFGRELPDDTRRSEPEWTREEYKAFAQGQRAYYERGFKDPYKGKNTKLSMLFNQGYKDAYNYESEPDDIAYEDDEVTESSHALNESDIDRAYMLSVDFTPERLEIQHKGMTDIDSAIAVIADGRPKDKFMHEIQVGGLPASFELVRDNQYTLIILDTNLRSAIESMVSMDLCQQLLAELEINEDVFFGFLIQGKTGDIMDDSTELEEDEDFQAPEFIVSSEKLNAEEMAQDPMFITVMNKAFLTVAEQKGERLEDFHPDMNDVDAIIDMAEEFYPNGQKYSFMIGDPMAKDAVLAAFNILWDEGKIGPEYM